MSSSNLKVKRSMSVMWIAAAVALFFAARTVPSLSAPQDNAISSGAAQTTVVAASGEKESETELGR